MEGDSGRIDVVTTNQGDVYFYVPVGSENLGVRTSTIPIFLVFGNEAYTKETAKQTVIDSGLAEIAKIEGSIVVFINPENETWSASDVKSYEDVLSHFSESDTLTTIDEGGLYPGWKQRVYLYAEGSGADFVAENFTQEIRIEEPTPWGLRTPAFITLFNNTVLPSDHDPDFPHDIPIVTVNGPESIEESLKALNRKSGLYAVKTSEEKNGFVKELILSSYEELAGTTRRTENVILKIPDYEAEDITHLIEVRELSTGPISYHVFIPNHLDMTQKGHVPLLFTFHGGGNSAEFQALTSEWPLVGNKEGFIVVSVDKHGERDSEEIVELLKILFKEFPAIDKTRVYASGFSMGGLKSWNLGVNFPQYFAGIIPMGAGLIPEGSDEFNPEISNPEMINQLELLPYKMPFFYIAGGTSPLPELPSQSSKPNCVDDAIGYFLKVNKITDTYQYDANEDATWGIAPTSTYKVRNDLFGTDTLVSLYASEDHHIYTALAVDIEKSHEVYGVSSFISWDFISQFSRNADGTIAIVTTDEL